MPVLFFFILLVLLLGLPLLGITIQGADPTQYCEMPPLTRFVQHADFSWPIFIVLSCFLTGALLPFLLRIGRSEKPELQSSAQYGFPWWAWTGSILVLVAWVLAWNRFSWFDWGQRFTFPCLWLGYILLVNGLTYRRTGNCLLRDLPVRFGLLFAVSLVFWWFFEYLNRFVQNWYYVGVQDYSALEYTFYASLSFATVLPAVLSTRELLLSSGFFQAVFQNYRPVQPARPRLLAWGVWLLACLGLALIGVFPDYLFPLLWVAPMLILISILTLMERKHILVPLQYGDWSLVLASATAALVCGFFWEMWNVFSLPKWEYSIPFVGRFHVFEMPVLGYAGYLPFGLECAVVAEVFVTDDFSSQGITSKRGLG